MPYRANRLCVHPGCAASYQGQGGYCPVHATATKLRAGRDYNANRRDEAKNAFEMSARWRKTRHIHLGKYPLCYDCEAEGIVKQAAIVHHVDDDWRNTREDNLMSLCRYHHGKRTAREAKA